jgi:hypothetical protein
VTWLKVNDTALTHEKTLLLRAQEDPSARPALTAEAVIGFVMLAATWSGQHNTDCFIAESVGPLASPLHWRELAGLALKTKILVRAPAAIRKARGGHAGWLVQTGPDEIFHLLTKEQVERNRAHRAFGRRVENKIAVLLRDGDQCRYCAQTVDPDDRKGGRGRTWDHPDPEVHDVIVVACRRCNSSKNKRTVPEWVADGGRELLPTPAERGETIYLEDKTRAWLAERGANPSDTPAVSPARTGSQPDDAATADAADQARSNGNAACPTTAAASTRIRFESDPNPIPPEVAGHAAPGRDGPGRAGSGSPGSTPTSLSRDGPRSRRGSRGRRGRQPRAP